jgi:hypothetical protein
MSQCTSCPTRSPPWHMYAHRPYACSRAHRPRKQFQRLHAEEKPLPVCPPVAMVQKVAEAAGRLHKPVHTGHIPRAIPKFRPASASTSILAASRQEQTQAIDR